MFHQCEEPGAANEAVTYEDGPEAVSYCEDSASQNDRVTGINLRSLPAGTAVVVDTRHSRYRFVMLDESGRSDRGFYPWKKSPQGRLDWSGLVCGTVVWRQ